jgi:hypothetical protein
MWQHHAWYLYYSFSREKLSDGGRNEDPDGDHVDAFPNVDSAGLQCRSVDVADQQIADASGVCIRDSCRVHVLMTACGISRIGRCGF